jgi:hypothetical protein
VWYSPNSHDLILFVVPSQFNSRLGFIYPGLTLTKMVLWSSMTWMTMAVTMDDLMIFSESGKMFTIFWWVELS